MKKSKVGYLIIASLLVWVLVQFFFLPATCSAEPAYMITESELVTLEQNSNRQLAISSQLAVDRCTELVEETRKLTERNLEILATIRTRGTTGDRSQD